MHLNRVTVKSTPSGVTDQSMSMGWAVKTILNHLAQCTELTEMKKIKVNLALIIGVDRGPFVTIYTPFINKPSTGTAQQWFFSV